ncbi:GNAT family N-acetyltransferase [Prochlorococcus marinus]|uniref:GNAT family N-acetyltransferase n=1 Tax=Prochlorococcus marinus XMU1408 TaxID=2213228 RepID=A0A318R3D2_PROMR|nr:GNAT family N-acetyltransferase [Prochlorococcus marinus]MBW3041588.1 GNAT family N-acetyltransferase [Prochlorococcus marinus str. XMU1408]PYE02744.1 GNAT family N-acetyltransferase [Prochlorococcus marinus XMU1408]
MINFGSNKLGMQSGRNQNILPDEILKNLYGNQALQYINKNNSTPFIFSDSKSFDLIELEQLLQAVGWGRRPLRRVKRALDNSLIKVGLWQHDPKFPRLIGFARCTGDGFIDATIWDVAINPVYQGYGLGKQLMSYLMRSLKREGITRVTLFADSDVVTFYKRQGWNLEPKGNKCAFWYSN